MKKLLFLSLIWISITLLSCDSRRDDQDLDQFVDDMENCDPGSGTPLEQCEAQVEYLTGVLEFTEATLDQMRDYANQFQAERDSLQVLLEDCRN
jgi:hypothetical protein